MRWCISGNIVATEIIAQQSKDCAAEGMNMAMATLEIDTMWSIGHAARARLLNDVCPPK